MPDHPRDRARLGAAAAAAFLVGVAVVATSLLLLGILAAEGDTTPITSRFSEVNNGTAMAGRLVPPYAPEPSVLEVEYAFPAAPGDVYVVHCADMERIRQGSPPLDAIVHERGVRAGSFSWPMADYLGFGTIYFHPEDSAPGEEGTQVGTGIGSGGFDMRGACVGAFVLFRWDATDANSLPTMDVTVRKVPLDSVPAALLFGLAALGGAVAVVGGLAWGRRRRADPPDAGAGTAETLLRLAQRAEAWLARTRRYVLISGPVGIFLWYPVLVPWAWRLGREGSASSWMPWLLAASTLAFLAGLTLLWAREFLRLDRELASWRAQLAELHQRETILMAELA